MSLTSRFEEAIVYALRLHAQQRRKGSDVPYAAHLLAVASTTLDYGGSEDQAIAALLHDAVEDQGGAAAREAIRQRFGETVAAIIDGCTDTDQSPKPPWRARKEAYLQHLQHAPPSVGLVAAADKLHNARCLLADYRTHGEQHWERFTGARAGTLWYYRAAVSALQGSAPDALIAELDTVVTELERLAGQTPAVPTTLDTRSS